MGYPHSLYKPTEEERVESFKISGNQGEAGQGEFNQLHLKYIFCVIKLGNNSFYGNGMMGNTGMWVVDVALRCGTC